MIGKFHCRLHLRRFAFASQHTHTHQLRRASYKICHHIVSERANVKYTRLSSAIHTYTEALGHGKLFFLLYLKLTYTKAILVTYIYIYVIHKLAAHTRTFASHTVKCKLFESDIVFFFITFCIYLTLINMKLQRIVYAR